MAVTANQACGWPSGNDRRVLNGWSFRDAIERHCPKPEGQVGLEMQRGDDFAHRQSRDVAERVGKQAERGGAGPGFLQRDVLEMETHQLADPWATVDMRNDLPKEGPRLHAVQPGVMGDRAVLV